VLQCNEAKRKGKKIEKEEKDEIKFQAYLSK